MPNGRNHGFVVQTRQKADELFVVSASADSPIDAGAEVELNIRKVEGYARILFLAHAAAAFTIHVLEGTTKDGTFVEVETLIAAANPDGTFVVCESIEPCGSYMQIVLENGGVAQPIELKVLGRPV